jgi:hypothetical protein
MAVQIAFSEKATPFLLLISILALPVFAGPVLTVAAPDPQTFIEQTTDPLTYVTFTVTNNDPNTDYILDFAAEIISPPAELDDQVLNNGYVSASTYILADTPANALAGTNVGTYTFGVYNPLGDPTDCCDPGVNPIAFYIEMSPMATLPDTDNIATNAGYGQFVFQTGGSSTGDENLTQYNLLLNCLGNGTCPAVVTNGVSLFSNGVDGNPYPATTSVIVLDTPEPSTWVLLATGCGLLASRKRRRIR